jgi:hypothetical protein
MEQGRVFRTEPPDPRASLVKKIGARKRKRPNAIQTLRRRSNRYLYRKSIHSLYDSTKSRIFRVAA